MEMVGQLIKILFYMSLFHMKGYGKCDNSGNCFKIVSNILYNNLIYDDRWNVNITSPSAQIY